MDYQKGKIYKIESHLGDKIYIGSTTKEYLSQRMTAHRGDYNSWKKGNNQGKISSFELFEEYGVENCNIFLLEQCPCNSKDELRAKEGYYIKILKCVNKLIPGRTVKENKEQYYKYNKVSILENRKLFYLDNKEKIRLRQTQPFNCECGCVIQRTEKPRHQRSKKHMDLMKAKEN